VEVFEKAWYTYSMATENTEVTNEATTESTEATRAKKDNWVRTLATILDTTQKDAEAILSGVVQTARILFGTYQEVPLPGLGTFEVRTYSAVSAAPLSKEEKAAGVTVEQKRAGAPLVERKKVVFRMAAAVARDLNGHDSDEQVAA
jgi:nucleoid DNA-binding protein